MKKQILSMVGSLAAGVGLALGQGPAPTPTPSPEIISAPAATMPAHQPVLSTDHGTLFSDPSDGDPGNRFWGRAEYLLWWVKGTPLSVPILTTGNPANAIPGVLGQPGTQVISPNSLNFGPFSGMRANAGMWWNDDRTFGGELVCFVLDKRAATFNRGSTPPGGLPLFVPFSRANPPTGEDAQPLNILGGANNATVISSLRLWGGEANDVFKLMDNGNLTLTGIFGCRFLHLSENLQMGFNSSFPAGPTGVILSDRFSTRNQFLGCNLGVRGQVRWERFFASLSGKCAVGGTRETVNVNGNTSALGVGFPGGAFAQPTAFGQRSRDVFCVVPEVIGQVGVDVTDNIRAFVGYDFLYASAVARPGDQIDRRINVTQTGGGILVGPPLPTQILNSTDFWAHGLNAGIQLSF